MANFLKALNQIRRPNERFGSWKELRSAKDSPEIGYNEWKNMKSDMQNFFRYVRKMMELNPELSNEDIINEIENFIFDTRIRICSHPGLRSKGIRRDVVNYFKTNRGKLQMIYADCIQRERKGEKLCDEIGISYSSNFEEAQKQFVEEMIASYRAKKKSAPNQETIDALTFFASLSSKNKKIVIDTRDEHDKEIILENYMFFTADEMDGIMKYFDTIDAACHDEQKNEYVESIVSQMLALDEMGALDKYLYQYNEQMRKNRIPEMQMTKEEVVRCYSDLDNSILGKFNMAQLSSLNSFWTNRLSKEIEGFNTAFFATKTLSLWDDIRNGELQREVKTRGESKTITVPIEEFDFDSEECSINIPLSQKLLETLAEKVAFLKSRYRHISSAVLSQPDIEDQLQQETVKNILNDEAENENVVHFMSLNDEIDKETKEMGLDYQTYFSRINGGVLKDAGNDFFEDTKIFFGGENARVELYTLKDHILNAQLFSLFNNQMTLKNWGIYFPKKENLDRKRMVVIALDVQGLNMPIRLHVPKSKVLEFMKSNGYGDYFPVYQGVSDFQKGNTYNDNIGAPLLMPTSLEYGTKVKKALESVEPGSRQYHFLKHLESLIDGKIPDHLKDVEMETKKRTIQQGKGRRPKVEKVTVEKRRFKERYYCFSDGKIYVKNSRPSKSGQDEYVEDEEYWSR